MISGPKFETIYDGRPDPRYHDPYLTRGTWGKWFMHVFWRGDKDTAFHDHKRGFWTFPLITYYEHVLTDQGEIAEVVVKAFRLHYRPARYRHKLIGRVKSGILGKYWTRGGPILTFGRWDYREPERDWGFWVLVQGSMYLFVPWKDYVIGRDKPL